MASGTVMTLCSSFSPKLAAFNSPTPTLLPLPLPPRSFSCSYSLPTPCLKASYAGIRVPQTSRDFKCYVSTTTTDGVPVVSRESGVSPVLTPGVWDEIPDVKSNSEVQQQGRFAVDKENKKGGPKITFKSVMKAQTQLSDGIYNLWIEGEQGGAAIVYEAVVFIGPPIPRKELKAFVMFALVAA